MTIDEKLKKYKSDKKLTSIQLAEKLGVNIGTLNKWMNKQRTPSIAATKYITYVLEYPE